MEKFFSKVQLKKFLLLPLTRLIMKTFVRLLFIALIPFASANASELPSSYYKLHFKEKKKFFFEFFSKEVQNENIKILRERAFVKSLHGNKKLSIFSKEYKMLQRLQIKYKLANMYNYNKLLRRIDVIPPALALAQAATESGWGQSRFFKEANNIFGHWTYNPRIGMIPLRRQEGKKHYIRIFKTLQASIAAYMLNLNRTGAYYEFRAKRREMRIKEELLDGEKLSETMTKYSGIGHNYVKILKSIISKNNLKKYDKEFYNYIKTEERKENEIYGTNQIGFDKDNASWKWRTR